MKPISRRSILQVQDELDKANSKAKGALNKVLGNMERGGTIPPTMYREMVEQLNAATIQFGEAVSKSIVYMAGGEFTDEDLE